MGLTAIQPRLRFRPAPQPGRDPALDGLRGLAILLVLAGTYLTPPWSPNLAGALSREVARALAELASAGGVLFFTLSGYLLTSSLWDTLHSGHLPTPAHWLRNFYARRALRLFPLYYALVLFATFAALVRGVLVSDLGPLRLYAFFLENLPFLKDRAAQQPSPVSVHHLWPVAVMLQFACAWPLLLLAAANRRRAIALTLGLWLASLVFCLVIWSAAGIAHQHALDEFPLTYASTLALGALVALLGPVHAWEGIRRSLRWTLAAGIAGCIATAILNRNVASPSRSTFLLGLPSAGLAAASLLALVLEDGTIRRRLSTPLMIWAGRLSYGIYVIHVLILPGTDAIAGRIAGSSLLVFVSARFVAGLLLSVILAFLFYELIEVPLLRLRRRFPFLRPAGSS